MPISVVVPARGRPAYLAEAIASVVAQTRPPDEVIVSEDGRDPGVAAVIARAPIAINHIVNETPLGQLGNRRQAFQTATGDLVAMLDDDDRWSADFLATMETALDTHPGCAFASADHWWMNERGDVMDVESDLASRRFGRSEMADGVYDDVFVRTLTTQPFPLQFTLFRRAALEEVGFFPDTAGTTPDFALMLMLGLRGDHAVYVNRRLGAYRVHAGQHTATGRLEMSSAQVASLRAVAATCDSRHRRLLARRYRESIVENAIALAHLQRRREAVAAVRRLWALGPGAVPPRRLLVLAALMLGARPRIRTSGS